MARSSGSQCHGANGKATGDGLDGRGVGVGVSAWKRFFLFFTSTKPVLGLYPAFYPSGIRGSSSGGEASGGVKLTTHLQIVSRPRIRESIFRSTSPYVFMA
jgi:hypothetical protein